MSHPEPYDWLRPKLTAIVSEAEQAGIARDVTVAVITDLINGPDFNTAPLEVNEGWNQDIGEPDGAVNETGALATEGSFASPAPGGISEPGGVHLRSLHPSHGL